VCWPLFALAEDAAITDLFSKAGVTGTLVIESVKTGQRFVHNDTRAREPFTPASTFKVLNTLIEQRGQAQLPVYPQRGNGPGSIKWKRTIIIV
jgi:beta-lactamase class D